jgi:hypothetical protein
MSEQITGKSSMPPTCSRHGETMILAMWDRPGGPPGNGWMCQSCARERAAGGDRDATVG